MCGIIAFLSSRGRGPDIECLKRMNAYHQSRGPDHSSSILLNDGQLGLAHTRLSIIDLSLSANQPMSTRGSRQWIVFNGEIYNFRELRKRLKGLGEAFLTTSDTEVLLHALRRWGSNALQYIEGMFAFVYVDLDEEILIAARDRIGVKPLYYFSDSGIHCFSSTLWPLKLLNGFDGEIDPIARFEMLTAKYVGSPRSIYRQIKKIEPGNFFQLDFSGRAVNDRYWQVSDYLYKSEHEPEYTEEDWMTHLGVAVVKAVRRQLVADVPVGVFLSSGTDSSLVASLASQCMPSIQSFTVGFPIKKYNEAKEAGEIARRLGTDHHELFVTPQQVMDTLVKIPEYYDEPFGDASAVPTFLISRFARTKVKVILSGDGGDEQFFGYPRYRVLASIYPFVKQLPKWIKDFVESHCANLPRTNVSRLLSGLAAFPDEGSLYTHYMLENFARLTEMAGGGATRTLWKSGLFAKNMEGHRAAEEAGCSYPNSLMFADLLNYLPDDCLTKVDRASMANSLEVRVPLLDESVIKMSLNMPLKYKWNGIRSKVILKKLLRRYLPNHLVYRPKKGFGVPLDRWLFNELKEFTMDMLSPKNLLKADLDPKGVHKIIDHHVKMRFDHQYFLWPVCCYVAWHMAQNR